MIDHIKNTFRDNGRMLVYAVLSVLALLALFLLAQTIATLQHMGQSPYGSPNSISVTGVGKSEAAPTVAHVSFTVEETAPTVTDAQNKASTKTKAALDAVHALGIADKDVQAAGYQTNPQYENIQPCFPGGPCPQSQPKIIGYQVSQTITVKIRKTDATSDVLKALGNVGVQNISGPNFAIDDDTQVVQDARGKAIENARESAELLARQLHVHLGEVISYSDDTNQGNSPSPYGDSMGVMKAAAPPVPVPAGQQETAVTVYLTYEIR